MGRAEDTEISTLHLNYNFGINIIYFDTEGEGTLDKTDSVELIEYLVETFNIQETEINFQ